MYDRKLEHVGEVLRIAELKAKMGEKPLYIVCGKTGPTGKTWLWNALRQAGHNAIEITESIGPFVEYRDDENHIHDGGFGQVVVVLNKPILRELKGMKGVYV